MEKATFEDFYEVPNLKFDVSRLRSDLDKILEHKKFNSPGVTHFGAIPINQVPNDENSIKGNNIRGKYWTIACLLYTSPSPRDLSTSRMPSSA